VLPAPGARDLADDLARDHDGSTRHALGSWRPAGQALSIAAEFEALSWPEDGSSTTRETGRRQVNPGDVARLRGIACARLLPGWPCSGAV